jgi:hypothetical protein
MGAARTRAILKLAAAKDRAAGQRRAALLRAILALCYGAAAAQARWLYSNTLRGKKWSRK